MTKEWMIEVVLNEEDWPSEGKDTDGLVMGWWVKVGDRVRQGDTLAEVVIVKTTLEVTVPEDGMVGSLCVEKGNLFRPGTVLAVIEN